MNEACQACHGGVLERDEYASADSYLDHYRCQNPACRAGGVHNPESGHTTGPVFEGHTPLAGRIARQTTAATTTETLQS